MLPLLLLACASAPAPPGRILAVADDAEGVADTVVLTPATGELVPLVSGLAGRVFPAAADPLGTHALVIGSSEVEEGHRESLALVPLGGGTAQVLAPAAEVVRNPSWSADGQWLVFESNQQSFRDLYKVRRDGTGLVRLTKEEHGSFEPSFSPDGSRIVFASSRDGNAKIYTMTADGGDVKRLTNEPRDDVAPVFSADGEWVLWIRQIGGTRLVHRMRASGADPHALRLPDSPVVSHSFAQSPDGSHVAITEQTGSRELDVVVVRVKDKVVTATLGGDGVDEMPAWSGDSQWVVWSSGATGDVELVVARRDGTLQRQVTTRKGADWLPRWIP